MKLKREREREREREFSKGKNVCVYKVFVYEHGLQSSLYIILDSK